MWVGEQITEHGIGNGISLLIMAGIIARLPENVQSLVQSNPSAVTPILLLVLFFAVVVVVVYITKGTQTHPRPVRQAHARPPGLRGAASTSSRSR